MSRYCSLNPFISGIALCSEQKMSAFPLQHSSLPYHPWTCREPDISGGGSTDSGSCWPCRWRSFCYGDTDSWLGQTGSDGKSPGEEAVCHQSITELSKHGWHVLHQHCITKPSIFCWCMQGAETGSMFFTSFWKLINRVVPQLSLYIWLVNALDAEGSFLCFQSLEHNYSLSLSLSLCHCNL